LVRTKTELAAVKQELSRLKAEEAEKQRLATKAKEEAVRKNKLCVIQ
jgi:hypothetical protein